MELILNKKWKNKNLQKDYITIIKKEVYKYKVIKYLKKKNCLTVYKLTNLKNNLHNSIIKKEFSKILKLNITPKLIFKQKFFW